MAFFFPGYKTNNFSFYFQVKNPEADEVKQILNN